VWSERGEIECVRVGGKGTHRYYNIKSYLEKRGIKTSDEPNTRVNEIRRKICYCRVSTRNQKDDLERQVQFLKGLYPTYEFIADIGSGLNFKRKGLKTVLEYAIRGEIQELVVAHKDRLCRFGFDLIEWIINTHSKGQIIVLNNHSVSKNEELVQDILAIITVFSARVNGLRKYKTTIQTDLGNKTHESNENPIRPN
jgi:predicted site-specific integrase-resolvase